MSKFRTDMTLTTCLAILSLITAKYSLTKEFIDEIRTLLSITAYGSQLEGKNISMEQLLSLKNLLKLPNIKIMIQKLKNTIKRNVDYCGAIEKKNDFDYIGV